MAVWASASRFANAADADDDDVATVAAGDVIIVFTK